MIRRYVFLAVAIPAVMLMAGCDYLPFGYTPIKDIVTAPANFEGKEVKLKGKVSGILRLPIVELKSFVLQDDTGEISVQTKGNLPAIGDQVALRGNVTSPAIIGGQALGLHVRETKRLK